MRSVLVIAAAAAAMLPLSAGGFWLQVGNPEANTEAQTKNAVLIVRATGCHDPTSATVTGAAVGYLNGERRTMPLKLVPLSQPGTYAVTRQWPAEGEWLIELTGHNGAAVTSTILKANSGGIDRTTAKMFARTLSPADETALLTTPVTAAK